MSTLSFTDSTLTVNIQFWSNSVTRPPDQVVLFFEPADTEKIQRMLEIAAREQVMISLDFDAQDLLDIDPDGNEQTHLDFEVDYSCLRIYPDGGIWYYAQGPEASHQIESRRFTLADLTNPS